LADVDQLAFQVVGTTLVHIRMLLCAQLFGQMRRLRPCVQGMACMHANVLVSSCRSTGLSFGGHEQRSS
jgi:hypothetical protein